MNTRWILNKIPHRPIKYLATISYLKISSWFARWSSGEDAFCKGTPHGIILQLVNSCPHPVSRTLCASSPSSSFLSFSRHDPNSFIFFLFPLVLRSPIFDRAKRREKKKGEEEYKRDRRDIHGYIYIYILWKRDITELGTKMVDRCMVEEGSVDIELAARDQTVCLPVKNRDGYYHACFFTRASGCKTEGNGVCMQGTYVRTVYREDPRRWIAALLNCLNGYRTDSIAATREPALISMGIVNPFGGGIYYFQVSSFGQIDSITISKTFLFSSCIF